MNPEEGNTMEQLPILQTRCNSDFGKLLQITNGVWNSNYSLNIVKEDKKRSNNDSSNVKPESNYVPHCGSGER